MYFEKENINTKDNNSELMMEIMCSFAQEESRNLSENIQWGYQRRFENGEIFTKYKNFMGYMCKDGELVIVPEEAEIVRKIFELYLDGKSLIQIKEYLESHHIKTDTGKEIWSDVVILKMLKNEKYKGDTMLQKTYTKNYLTGERAVNDGQRARYYVANSHQAIVSKEMFDRVQEELVRRSRIIYNEDGTTEIRKSRYNGKYLLGNLLVCGECGTAYRRRTERGKVVWRCATRIEKGKDTCLYSPTIKEEWIQDILAEMICEDRVYNEKIIRQEIKTIRVYPEHAEVVKKNGEVISRSWIN